MRRVIAGLAALSCIAAAGAAGAAEQTARPAAGFTSMPLDQWKSVVAAARKEGSVTLYSTQVPAVLDRLKADFENAHPGIKLEYVRTFAGGAMLGKLDQERQTNSDGGDIAVATEAVGFAATKEFLDALAKGLYKAPAGPSAASWPARYILSKAVPVLALEPIVLAYNPELVKVPVTTYKDLLRPELRGRIGTIDLVAITVFAWYDWLEKSQGPEFLGQLAAQKPRLYPSAVPNAQAVVSGEIAASAFTNPSTSLPLIAQGAPIKIVIPKPGFGIRYAGVLPAWARRPNAAQVFMDYLMSVRGQVAWGGTGAAASPLPNIPGSVDAATITPYDPAPYTADWQKSYRVKWDAMFKK